MTCQEIRGLLPKYHARHLDPQQHDTVREHIVHCPHCRRILHDMGGEKAASGGRTTLVIAVVALIVVGLGVVIYLVAGR